MYLRSVDRKTAERLGLVAGLDDRSIRESLGFGDEVDLGVSVFLGKGSGRTTSIRKPSAPFASHQCIMS
jgi:hypothetical protein